MKKYSWLLAIMLLIASCTGTDEVSPRPKDADVSNSNARVATGPSSFEYPTQTINFSDAQGTYSYDITASVSWSGSTTTWTYEITGIAGTFNPRAISHISFAGFESCFTPSSITTTSGEPKVGGKEGTDFCSENGLDGNDTVIKIDEISTSSLTITFTYDQALEATDDAARLYVKTATVCDFESIPGPSCETLGVSGNVKELYCDGVQSSERPVVTEVVATQTGEEPRSTYTDEYGNFSFDNLGGIWDITAVGQTIQVVLGAAGDVAGVNFVNETRPNGSCAEITGSAERFDCNGTASVHSLAGLEVMLSGAGASYSASTTTDANGTYTFSNVPVGEYTVTFAGVTQSVSITSESGSTDLDFSVDNRINGSCAAISGYVELTQCLDQSTSVGPWAGVTVTAVNGAITLTTTTDANGNFTFANVIDGTYSVTVNGESQSVSVANSEGSYELSYAFDIRNGVCGGDEETACSLSQGYWFAKPQAVWPNGTVTLGGFVYSQAEGKAIWNTSNKGGLLNAKAAFTQASAIKLSGVDPSASVWADVAIIDAYFASLGRKITPTSIPKNSTANAAAGAAAGRIGKWIDANHCNESK